MRALILAFQFLTRLPMPQLRGFQAAEQVRSVVWFPFVGAVLGGIVAAVLFYASRFDPWFAALLGLMLWVGVTGALHLDGLADLADALGAAHRDRERLLAVLADPHVGVFGVVVVVMQLLSKLVLLMLLARLMAASSAGAVMGIVALVCIPAWARWGGLIWMRLPTLKPGLAERFAWRASAWATGFWGVLLLATAWAAQLWGLLLAPLVVAGWYGYLRSRLGGMTGDALGAGIEVTETVLLMLVLGVML